jgi:hypothetical protein
MKRFALLVRKEDQSETGRPAGSESEETCGQRIGMRLLEYRGVAKDIVTKRSSYRFRGQTSLNVLTPTPSPGSQV